MGTNVGLHVEIVEIALTLHVIVGVAAEAEHFDGVTFGTEAANVAKCRCFPATARLTLDNGKSVMMSELQKGDRVQTGMDKHG